MFATVCCFSCTSSDKGEKRQGSRNEIVNVHDKVKIIDCEEVLIGSMSETYIFDKYLVIADYKSLDAMIHVFDKNSFKYLHSFGIYGQGPKEITVLGALAWNGDKHEVYVTDNAQHNILCYNLDSIFSLYSDNSSRNPQYVPSLKAKVPTQCFPNDYVYVNDTLSYGSFISFTSSSSFGQTTGKWNMLTGEAKLIDYVNPPSDKKKRVAFAVSLRHDRIVECNRRYDLMTLYNLDGELQCNVYGPQWTESGDGRAHFSHVAVCGDKIIASYIGEEWQKNDGARKFLVFSMSGNYLKTLDVGFRINRFCCDEENNRIIMNLDSEIQFGYLDLEGLI